MRTFIIYQNKSGNLRGFLKFIEKYVPVDGFDFFELRDNEDIVRKTLTDSNRIKKEKC